MRGNPPSLTQGSSKTPHCSALNELGLAPEVKKLTFLMPSFQHVLCLCSLAQWLRHSLAFQGLKPKPFRGLVIHVLRGAFRTNTGRNKLLAQNIGLDMYVIGMKSLR